MRCFLPELVLLSNNSICASDPFHQNSKTSLTQGCPAWTRSGWSGAGRGHGRLARFIGQLDRIRSLSDLTRDDIAWPTRHSRAISSPMRSEMTRSPEAEGLAFSLILLMAAASRQTGFCILTLERLEPCRHNPHFPRRRQADSVLTKLVAPFLQRSARSIVSSPAHVFHHAGCG